MIITQYRGLSDVDTVDTESKFAQIFEGWIDTSHGHDDHNTEEPDVDADHEEDDEEENNVSEEEEHEASEEDGEDETEENEASDELDEANEEEGDDEDEDLDSDQSDEEQLVEESDENALDNEDEDREVSEEDTVDQDVQSDEKEDEDETDEEEDQNESEPDHDEDEQELENIVSSEDHDGDDNAPDDEQEDSTEIISKERDENEETDENIWKEAEQDKSPEKESSTIKTQRDSEEAPQEEFQQESSGTSRNAYFAVAVKLGVGVALLVVAHLVLVRKWRTAPDENPTTKTTTIEEFKESSPDLSRRNTIVAPPPLQDVEPDIEQDEEEYSEEEESEEEEHIPQKSAKTRYQELRSSYTRSLTPEGEIDYNKEREESEEEYADEEEEDISEEGEEEDEDIESENEEYDDDDEDEELLKRLEAKYGKLRGDKNEGGPINQDVDGSDSHKQPAAAAGYEYSKITNKEDHKITDELDEAQKFVQNKPAFAIKLFDNLLQKYPSSPRSKYGKALALDYLADQKRSNEILEEALNYYIELLNTENVPDALFIEAAERCINKMRFVGQYANAIYVHNLLRKKFPNIPKYSNDLAVTYLTINRVEKARYVLKDVLSKWPNDGFALVHYGFILKTTDDKLEEAVVYLRRGLATKAEGVVDGRFYFHLGDALSRLGRNTESMEVYEDGVQNKVFLSKYQRSLYNVPRLTGRPFWEITDLPYLDMYRLLTQNWEKIKDEGLAMNPKNLKDTGNWKQFELFARGQKNIDNCKKCPFTCSIIEMIPEARGCKRGQTKFSVMHPGTHVWPHCGPTNCRLRLHLGLKVPSNTFIRVADEIRSWEEGSIFVFDDSFEHEVWHNGTDLRLVLIVDVWHPELTPIEKKNLSPI
ncbi:hypothetical protein NQ317_000657 [Molorchus minor]|uniref:Aspartyl/asparaginy/proline hydroxylase domain-containing protein n=1 Tax=Molorchus minor TaxID=1323400 RepID=A0ABQ9J3H3_9CUCU|nr:hypothetical protein NQ317_000657 [Molorchus minor]